MGINIIIQIILTLFINDGFHGNYYKCSARCLRTDIIYIQSPNSVYTSSVMEKSKTVKYLIGNWSEINDSTILMNITIDKRKVELMYVLKNYDDLFFLVSMEENVYWTSTINKIDSAFRNSEELELLSYGIWKDVNKKKEALEREKREICSQLFYLENPAKDIYIKE
jgi:hypothetical protein